MTETDKFGVIYVDPPWRFTTYSAAGRGRTADAWYDTMSLDEIKALPVAARAASNCALFCWVTDPFLETAFDVLRAWGFKFKTVAFYWVKLNKDGTPFKGLGHWTRGNPEQCLLATRGSPPRLSGNVDKLIMSPRREHSRKPDEVYDRIEKLVDGPYLELFARTTRAGWDAFGNEIGILNDGAPPLVRRYKANAPLIEAQLRSLKTE
jgi:N6-adenosine-specific RNA methylase IME4